MNTQQLWQAQALDAPRISLAFVRQQSDALRRRTQRLNRINYIVGAICMPLLVWKCVTRINVEPLLSAAIALWVAGGLTGLFFRHKRIASQDQPAEFGVLDALRFHRRQLERQRDARLGVGRWTALLFVPGHILFFLGLFVEITPVPWTAIIRGAVVLTLITVVAIVMSSRRVRSIQREIDALDSL